MAIKKLQNNFTNPEQSKRLLKLGVPADSADCYYLREHPDRLCILNDGKTLSKLRLQLHMAHAMPCWSVGRLIEVYELCYAQEYIRDVGTPLMEDVLSAIYDAINDTTEQWDFSKLEDYHEKAADQ